MYKIQIRGSAVDKWIDVPLVDSNGSTLWNKKEKVQSAYNFLKASAFCSNIRMLRNHHKM
jgi:hypothetical protein